MINNPYVTQELARLHIADLITEAQRHRRVRPSRPQRGTRSTMRARHLLRRFLHRGLAGVDAPTEAGMAEHAV